MASNKDHFLVLGVTRGDSPTAIRRRYRDLVKALHPDVAGGDTTARLQEVNEAYEVLSDPTLQRRHQETLRARGARPSPATVIPVEGLDQPLREPASILARPEAVRPSSDALLAGFRRSATGRGVPKGGRLAGIHLDVQLTPAELARGGVLPVAVPFFALCSRCRGTGTEWLLRCGLCWGEGVVEDEAVVRIRIPPLTRPRTVIDVPLSGLGIHHFYLRLHIRVS